MSDEFDGDIVLICPADRGQLVSTLENDDRVTVQRVVEPAEVSRSIVDGSSADLVLELDDPETVRTTLQRIDPATTPSSVLVAPKAGSEKLAAVAFRNGATDYIVEDAEAPTGDRIVDSLQRRRAATDPAVGVSMGHAVENDERLFERGLPEEAFVIDGDGTYLDAQISENASELYSFPAEDLIGLQFDDVFSPTVASRLHECVTRTIETGEIQSIEYTAQTAAGARQFEARVVLVDEEIHGGRAVVWLARDVTDLRAKQEAVRSRQERLEQINEINEVIKEVVGTVVESPSRSAIERNVCERLVESDLYRCAIVGGIGQDADVFYRTGRGGTDTELESLLEENLGYETVIETTEARTFSNGAHGDQLPESLAETGPHREINSAIVVPIDHDGVVYGVLAVFATRANAFGSREHECFQLLGESMGFSINAVKNRRLLFSDSVVELEIRIDGGDSVSFDLTAEYDCTCSLKWAGATTDGKTYQYVVVDGIDGETVRREATDHDSVQECRVIHDGDGRCIIELRLVESGVRALSNLGVTIRDITVEDNVGTCILDVPGETDIREILTTLGQIYQNTELVARREVDRSIRTTAEKRDRVLEALTDKQLTTLRVAYYGGYFDWPRGSTGEEIAAAMDVAPPTMHQHLRKALQELLREFLEEGSKANFDS